MRLGAWVPDGDWSPEQIDRWLAIEERRVAVEENAGKLARDRFEADTAESERRLEIMERQAEAKATSAAAWDREVARREGVTG